MANYKKIKILLTFDYELALGIDSGTLQKCILDPMDIILDIFKCNNARGIFFIDATYLMVLKKNKHKDFLKVTDNIKKIIKHGSDIGLHLHPQWIDSKRIKDNRWSFKTFKHYTLHSLDEKQIILLFKSGKKILEEIARKVKKNYTIDSFRAGGWSIQPFSRIMKFFKENNLKYDFSVNPGLSSDKNSNGYFDFIKAPKDKSFWKFYEDVCEEDLKGTFYEIPVSTVKVRKLQLLLNNRFYKKNEIEMNDGKYIKEQTNNSSVYKKVFNLLFVFKKIYSSISIDGLSLKIFCKFLNKKIKSNPDFLTFVGHPKKLSKSAVEILSYLTSNYKTLSLKEIKGIIK